MAFLNSIATGSSQITQAVKEQSHVTAEINRNVLSIKTLADDSNVGSQHAVHGINQLVRQLSDLDRLVRQFQKAPPRPPNVATKCSLQTPCRYAKPDSPHPLAITAEKPYGPAGPYDFLMPASNRQTDWRRPRFHLPTSLSLVRTRG